MCPRLCGFVLFRWVCVCACTTFRTAYRQLGSVATVPYYCYSNGVFADRHLFHICNMHQDGARRQTPRWRESERAIETENGSNRQRSGIRIYRLRVQFSFRVHWSASLRVLCPCVCVGPVSYNKPKHVLRAEERAAYWRVRLQQQPHGRTIRLAFENDLKMKLRSTHTHTHRHAERREIKNLVKTESKYIHDRGKIK